MRNRKSLVMLPLAVLGLAACFFAQRRVTPPAVRWQVMQEVNVYLFVRDKEASLGSYEAQFFVTAPGGKEWAIRRRASASDPETGVFFPQDFNEPEPPAGRYAWRCVVGNAIVIRGEFDYERKGARSSATADTGWTKGG